MKENIFLVIIVLIKFKYTILIDKLQKKIIINRYIPDFNPSSEEKFYPYNFSSDDFIDGGIYVFDTASLYTWKNNISVNNSDSENEISITTKDNVLIKGNLKLNSENLIWTSLNTEKYPDNFGSISIAKSIPESIKNKYDEKFNDAFYNYLDLIKDEINQNYINYVQTSINTGYILLGEKDDIFDKSKNYRDIKTCKCYKPTDNYSQNEFLNYWNCKITSFQIDNIKISSLYSRSIDGDIYAIFALSEEYIIAPKKTGEEIIKYYKNLIGNKKCSLENYNSDTKIMICKKFNYAELPDFTITLEGEISLIALSFDLFKNKNETHIYFKILLNELNTKEYWFLGDPIIKNYNFLFDFNKKEEEFISIVSSDKYNSLSFTLTSIGASVITFIYFAFLLFARIKINMLSKNKKKNQNEKVRTKTKNIKRIIRNQNDFEIPEGNIPIQNMIKSSNLINEEDSEELKKDEEVIHDDNEKSDRSEDNNSSNSLNSDSFFKNIEKEDNLEKKINELKKNPNNSNEFEMQDLNNLNIYSSDDEECEKIGEEGSLPPLNQSK